MFSDSTSLRSLSFDSISFARASRKAFGACPFLAALRGSRRATDVIFSSHEVREVLVGGRWGQEVGPGGGARGWVSRSPGRWSAATTTTYLEGVRGRYFDGTGEARANRQAYDPQAMRRLWALSEELCGRLRKPVVRQ